MSFWQTTLAGYILPRQRRLSLFGENLGGERCRGPRYQWALQLITIILTNIITFKRLKAKEKAGPLSAMNFKSININLCVLF